MADVAEHTTYTDAATAISQGKRHLLVQDYTAAVTALAEGLEMMSQKLGDCDDALGEPYLLYGRALLGLAREEVGVLGEGVPGSEEADEDDEEDEDDEDNEDDDKTSDTEAKDEEQQKEANEEKKVTSDNDEGTKKSVAEEKKEKEKEDGKASNKTDDKKIEEAKKEDASKKESTESGVAGTSKDAGKNEPSKSSNCNGTAAGTSTAGEDEDDVNKDEDEEDPGRGIDLQVAWEVLELAKIVFAKRGEAGLKHLAETHRLLGEVAMESDNHQGAIADLEGALALLEKIEPREPRALADIHYQLGLAHSLANDFDASIKQFAEATSLLEARIKQLEENPESAAKSDDPFYSVEGEIKELRELLPAIQEKIVDMKDFKEEACRLVIEGIKNKVASGSCTNGSSASNEAASASSENTQASSSANSKPASDISHLVRKKRKHESETEDQPQSPCKKPTP